MIAEDAYVFSARVSPAESSMPRRSNVDCGGTTEGRGSLLAIRRVLIARALRSLERRVTTSVRHRSQHPRNDTGARPSEPLHPLLQDVRGRVVVAPGEVYPSFVAGSARFC